MKSLIDCIYNNKLKNPNKVIFVDENSSITNKELFDRACSIASNLSNVQNKPIIIEMPKGVDCIVTMMGVMLSGNFYTVLDDKMPDERKNIIIDTLNPAYKITTKSNEKKRLSNL